MKLCIDPGHGQDNRVPGRYDPGAVGGGYTEAAIALEAGLTLNYFCKPAGVAAWMTRYDDNDPCPLNTRVSRALAQGCTHFVSLHCNAAANPLATGTETIYADDADLPLARAAHSAALTAWGLRDRGIKRERSANFPRDLAVLDGRMIGVLLEIGFISNYGDRRRMRERERRIAFAKVFLTRVAPIMRNGVD